MALLRWVIRFRSGRTYEVEPFESEEDAESMTRKLYNEVTNQTVSSDNNPFLAGVAIARWGEVEIIICEEVSEYIGKSECP
jgi:hypothetical protein